MIFNTIVSPYNQVAIAIRTWRCQKLRWLVDFCGRLWERFFQQKMTGERRREREERAEKRGGVQGRWSDDDDLCWKGRRMDRLPAFLVLDMHMALVAYSLSAYNWSPTRQRLHGFVGSKRACRRPLPPPDFNAIFSLSILTAEVKHCTVRIFTLKLQPLLLLPVLMFLHRMSCEFHEKQFDSTPSKISFVLVQTGL